MLPVPLSRLARYLPFEPLSILRLLVLLFPIGIIYVRHWGSTIFGLLILTALILWPYKKQLAPALHREEKIFIGILLGYFLVALASITANGWDEAGQYAIGTELRFLLIIPFYLVIRRIPELWRYLWIGCLLGIILTSVLALQGYLVVQGRPFGIYGPLFLGPVLLLMIALQLPWHRANAKYHWGNLISLLIALAGLYVVILSGARSAYITLTIGILVAFIYYFRARNSVISVTAAVLLLIVAYQNVNVAQNRVDDAVTDTRNYISYLLEHPNEPNKYGDSSAGQRLEMWRAAVMAAGESPVFGIGRYNFNKKLRQYAEEGRINPISGHHGHPHNVFFEALADKGILGLIAVLMLYLYPLVFFIRTRKRSPESAFAGILLMLLIGSFSMTAVAPVYFGNFVSVFLVFLTVIFAWHSRAIHADGTGQGTTR